VFDFVLVLDPVPVEELVLLPVPVPVLPFAAPEVLTLPDGFV